LVLLLCARWTTCLAAVKWQPAALLLSQSTAFPVCRRLRELRAANCGSLSLGDSELHCPALQEVNLFGNRQLDADGRPGACCGSTAVFGLPAAQLSKLGVPYVYSAAAAAHQAPPFTHAAAGLEASAAALSKCVALDLSGCTGLSRLLLPEATALQTVRCAQLLVPACEASAHPVT
jgi:hypothetical protein